tara:strand:- start:390 stop:1238 length:849 start_codon:yes stop_codon:yes gene_type:complete
MRKFYLLFSFFLILFFFNSCDILNKEEKIYGTWETNSVISEEDEDYDYSIIYYEKTEFLRGNRKNSGGKFEMKYEPKKNFLESFSLVFNFVSSESWKLEGNYIIETIQSFKILPDNDYTNKFITDNPDIMEDLYLEFQEGISFSNEIITLSDDFMRLKDTDIENDDPYQNYTRVKKVLEEDNSTERSFQVRGQTYGPEGKITKKSKQDKVSAAEKKARELELCKNLQQLQIKKYGSARADCEDRTKEEAYRIYVQQNNTSKTTKKPSYDQSWIDAAKNKFNK